MISAETATAIAMAYREIEASQKLLTEITTALERRQAPDIRDAFGHPARGLDLGVPSGDTSRRVFNVAWSLAKPVIEAHIADQRAQIQALNVKARAELGG